MSNNTDSQNKAILQYLRLGNAITTPIARQLCECERLAARINNIREILSIENKGEFIETEMVPFIGKNGRKGRYCRYYLKRLKAETGK